jgi:hypothetical protein
LSRKAGARGAAHRINHQLGVQHAVSASVTIDHPSAYDSVRFIRDRFDDVVAVKNAHVADGADPAPDMGFQTRPAGKVKDHQFRVGEFT